MSTARFIVGDVHDVLKTLPDSSVDLILCSPPFLALRSYLPADHPDKQKELGSEPTPGAFIDALLDVVEECRRVLAPHGSLCIELGDTYAGSGGGGGDYLPGGLREDQPGFGGSAERQRDGNAAHWRQKNAWKHQIAGAGLGDTGQQVPPSLKEPLGSVRPWPLDKSLSLVPESFRWALAYGRNPFPTLCRAHWMSDCRDCSDKSECRTTEPWRIRNVIRWCLDGDTVVYARTPKGEGPTRLLHLTQNWQPGQWSLWDGERWTPVLGWSATEASDAIEIEFRNGERVSATREHEWPTQRGLVRTEDLRVGDAVGQVRLPEPAVGEPQHLPDDEIGWLLGTFLADGSFDSRDRIQIAGHRTEGVLRHARLERLAQAYDGTASVYEHGSGNEGSVVVRSPVLAAVIRRYIGGDGARNKHLRPPCWRRTNWFLGALLEGYLHGDGHYDAKNDRWRLGFTDNPWLARDLRTLCARLGHSCRVKRLPRAADPRGGTFAGTASHYHRGEIRFRWQHNNRYPDGQVMALRQSKRRRFYDIGVKGEPHLFALASGLLTHNCRPNPPVGALGDKFRPATSEMVVACTSRTRYFDLDAVREPLQPSTVERNRNAGGGGGAQTVDGVIGRRLPERHMAAGAPPLDWWSIPTEPYPGSHYATWPRDLLVKPIKAMCPERVCRVCGEPSRRVVGAERRQVKSASADTPQQREKLKAQSGGAGFFSHGETTYTTLGWTDCDCLVEQPYPYVSVPHSSKWRPGVVLDPFAGSGTTLAVATGHGRDAIGIDLDERNADLALERVGPFFLTVERHSSEGVA